MCGIVAVADSAPGASDVSAAIDALAHRGPDGRGAWRSPDGRVALGHARLAILDLAGGAQPLSNEDGTIHAVVNGELYDHDRLLTDLRARGHRPRTESDSEVLVHLYEERGLACLDDLRGQFAFVLHDVRSGTLVAGRDRFGMKPLFWSQEGERLVLASEIRGLFALGVEPAWDPEGAFQALHFAQRVDRTLYRNVQQLAPGSALIHRHGRTRVRSWWTPSYPWRRPMRRQRDAERTLQEAGAALTEAVRLRTRADVPLGAYLSGGVDSSVVLSLARSTSGRDVRAFSIAFDHPEYDESDAASEQARAVGAPFERLHVTADDFAACFEDAVESGETLAYNGHVPARYVLSRAVQRAGIRVVLGGEGADELFGGYAFARGSLGGGSIGALLRFLVGAPGRGSAIRAASPLLARVSHALRVPPDLVRRAESAAAAHRALLDPDFVRDHANVDPFRRMLATVPARHWIGREPFQIAMSIWFRSHFVNYLLAADRLDMAHSVELRLPFLDHRLFESVRHVPSSVLCRGGRNKDLLRRIAAPHVTPRVLQGAKRPFIAPPGRPGDALFGLMEAIVHDRSFEDVMLFDTRAARAFVAELRSLPEAERRVRMPLLFVLASAAILDRRLVARDQRTTPPPRAARSRAPGSAAREALHQRFQDV
ncbi:MAG: asparagine synthase (glutamine-hydrolyzing) [Planctomycetota bacterium]